MSELLCEVRSGGLLTTIQDLGRPGYRQFGVPVSGAMDRPSTILANKLVGNPENAPVLEITQTGPSLYFRRYGALAITGADLCPVLNGVSISNNETVFFSKGDRLSFGPPRSGIRAYMAFSGDLSGEELFGSKSTHIGNQWGGMNGNALQKGDQLHLTPSEYNIRFQKVIPTFNSTKFIRVQSCLEFEGLSGSDRELLFSQDWKVTSESNRAGIRLSGTALKSSLPEMISSPTDLGIVQLPPSGQPIILMNDSAAIGGYPRIASVIQEDIPILVQKPPGASIRLKMINTHQ